MAPEVDRRGDAADVVDGERSRTGAAVERQVAIGSAVFASYGALSTPAGVTSGFKPALWACCGFAALGALAATAMSARAKPTAEVDPANLPVAA